MSQYHRGLSVTPTTSGDCCFQTREMMLIYCLHSQTCNFYYTFCRFLLSEIRVGAHDRDVSVFDGTFVQVGRSTVIAGCPWPQVRNEEKWWRARRSLRVPLSVQRILQFNGFIDMCRINVLVFRQDYHHFVLDRDF